MMSGRCCVCDEPATATTAVVDDESFQVCATHLRLWQGTPEDISLREWCRRMTAFGPEVGRVWVLEFFATTPLPVHDLPGAA